MFKFLRNYVDKVVSQIKDDILEDMQGRMNETEDSLRDVMDDVILQSKRGFEDHEAKMYDAIQTANFDVRDDIAYEVMESVRCEMEEISNQVTDDVEYGVKKALNGMEGFTAYDIIHNHNKVELERLVRKLEEVKEKMNVKG